MTTANQPSDGAAREPPPNTPAHQQPSAPAELDPAVDGTPEQLTERALVDSLLHDPRRLADVAAWLQPDDFTTGDARAVYRTLLGLQHAGELPAMPTDRSLPPTAEAVTTVALAAHRAWREQRFTRIRCPIENRIVQIWGTHPLGPSQHREYARDVVADATRRMLHTWGVRLRETAVRTLFRDGDTSALDRETRTLADYLTAATLRSQPNRRVADVLSGADHTDYQNFLDTVPIGPAPAAPPTALVRRASARLVEAFLANPGHLDTRLLDHITPADLDTAPAHAHAWQAMRSLRHQDRTIDHIAVAREARALALPAPILTPNDLARIARRPTSPDIGHELHTVAHHALSRHADRAQAQLDHIAADHATTVAEIHTSATQVADTLSHQTRRLAAAASVARPPVSYRPPPQRPAGTSRRR